MDLFSTLIAVVPSLAFLWYFHSRDLYPEPPRLVWATFLFGMLTFVPILLIAGPAEALLREVTSPLVLALAKALLLAAIPEEALKFAVLLLFTARLVRLEGPLDGLLYGVAASLGFATIENVLYVERGGLDTAILRGLTAIPCHAALGVVMGYGLGRAFQRPPRRRWLWLPIALFVPMAMHGAYDFSLFALASFQQTSGGLASGGSLALGFFALFVTTLVGGLIAAVVLLARARRERVGTLAPSRRATPVRELPAVGGIGAPLRMVLGAAIGTLGGWVLIGLVVSVASGIDSRPNAATALVIVLLMGCGLAMYGLGLFAQGLRMRGATLGRNALR